METTFIVKSFDHEDVVNILASSVESSQYIGVRYDKSAWAELPEEKKTKDACIEDKCADLLLAGKTIYLFDAYSEENGFEDMSSIHKGEIVTIDCGILYGKMRVMRYEVNINDFLEAANAQNGLYIKDFMDGTDDLFSSESFLQMVMFGEEIYG